jgi:hypothetical protein
MIEPRSAVQTQVAVTPRTPRRATLSLPDSDPTRPGPCGAQDPLAEGSACRGEGPSAPGAAVVEVVGPGRPVQGGCACGCGLQARPSLVRPQGCWTTGMAATARGRSRCYAARRGPLRQGRQASLGIHGRIGRPHLFATPSATLHRLSESGRIPHAHRRAVGHFAVSGAEAVRYLGADMCGCRRDE